MVSRQLIDAFGQAFLAFSDVLIAEMKEEKEWRVDPPQPGEKAAERWEAYTALRRSRVVEDGVDMPPAPEADVALSAEQWNELIERKRELLREYRTGYRAGWLATGCQWDDDLFQANGDYDDEDEPSEDLEGVDDCLDAPPAVGDIWNYRLSDIRDEILEQLSEFQPGDLPTSVYLGWRQLKVLSRDLPDLLFLGKPLPGSTLQGLQVFADSDEDCVLVR